MQVSAKTAANPPIDIDNVSTLENNIHAGVKYMAYLRDTYFSDPEISRDNKLYFSLAAYNAGPNAVEELRKRAKTLGLDPNRWFGNVERAALEATGPALPRYVANVYKYYVAYKSVESIQEEKAEEVAEEVGKLDARCAPPAQRRAASSGEEHPLLPPVAGEGGCGKAPVR